MIPQTIQIKNFLSYGPVEQTIHFAPYHLIYLSGKNGHGKSALLDAMSWAVWGQARKTTGTSKADEGLVHLGQKHMLVIFEFVVNNQRFKIRREYIKTASKPFASLEFAILQDDNSFKTLTDKTIALTQQKIDTTIGITYETFANSVFLRQGQSNEFSKKTPKERKDILAQILRLESFENIKRLASEKVKTIELLAIQQEAMLERIKQEIIDIQTQKMLLEQDLTQLQLITQEQTTQQSNKQEYLKKLELLQPSLITYQELIHKQGFIQQHLNQLLKQEDELNQKISTVNKQQETLSAYQELQKKHIIMQKDLADLQRKAQERLRLKEQFLQLQQQKQDIEKIHEQQEALKAQEQMVILHNLQLKQQEATTLEKQYTAQLHAYKTQLQGYEQKIKELKDFLPTHAFKKSEYTQLQKTYDAQKQEYATTHAALNQCTSLIQEKQQAQTAIQQSPDQSCKLCKQSLNQIQKEDICFTYDKEIEQLYTQEKKLQEKLKSLTLTVQSLEQELIHNEQINHLCIQKEEQLAALTTQKELLIPTINTLEQEITAVTKTLEKTIAEYTSLSKISSQEQTQPTYVKDLKYQELIESIALTIKQGKDLSYDQSAHEQLQKNYLDLQAQLQLYKQIEQDVLLQEERHIQLHKITQEKEKIIQEQATIAQNLATLSIPYQEKEIYTLKLSEIEECLRLLQQKYIALAPAQGAIQMYEKKQVLLEKEIEQLQIKSKDTSQELELLQTVIKTVSKDGVQALLIEQAIPEIEQEANTLLAELTNNQTQIYIESLRDLKKGGSKETLDIKISDPLGIRPYEMFSGGEAFRIDFALRIAISKLLARRAGTTLQTLIIDEGFGSQDEEGLHAMMECLTHIQHHFAKIIIISHLPEMKEHFPVEFQVIKKASGSVIQVITH